MDLAEAELLIDIFRQSAAIKRYETELATTLDRHDDDRRKRQQQREREKEEERERHEQLVEATAAQVAAFHATLDGYDTATAQALMDNQTALDDARTRRERMEASAARLPDARLVFKTEDGKRVFDRNGIQLSHNIVHPDAVPDSAPRWETMKALKDTENGLLQERDKLHAFQRRLDETRETVGKGHVSAEALAKLDADLKKDMPDAVKAQLPGAAAWQSAPELRDAAPAARATHPSFAAMQAPGGP